MKTAIYLRQSLDRDFTKVSVDYQRESLRKLCADKGWEDPVEYLDRNVSATTGRRHAYEDLCEDIRNGAVARVAVWDMDRLHRQPRELEDFIDLAEKHHVELANVGGDVDLSTPSGRMFARMKGTVAKYEVEQKSVRQKAANRERAKQGKTWIPGRSLGYDGDTVVEEEAELIRQACADVLNGTSLWAIAKDWNKRGILTAKGAQWNGGTVKQILVKPRNAGLQVYGGEIIEGVETAWPAIVSRDTWESICAYLSNPARHTGKKRARVHLLSGLAVCGLCGRKMGTTGRKTKRGESRMVYQCKNVGCMRVVRDLVKTDAVVIDIITSMLARPDSAAVFARASVDTKALTAKADEYRALIAAAEREYDDGIIDGRRLQGRIDSIQPKLDAIDAQLLGANTSRKLDGLIGQPDAAERFDALVLDRRRAVIDTMAVVTIKPSEKPGGRFDPKLITVEWRTG